MLVVVGVLGVGDVLGTTAFGEAVTGESSAQGGLSEQDRKNAWVSGSVAMAANAAAAFGPGVAALRVKAANFKAVNGYSWYHGGGDFNPLNFRLKIDGVGSNFGNVRFEAKGGVYLLRDRVTGQVMRTGRTNNLARRLREHSRDPLLGQYKFEEIYRSASPSVRRGLEQVVHDQYQPPLNRIRPIDTCNPNLSKYLKAANAFLRRQNE
jgi:hypothetical protein